MDAITIPSPSIAEILSLKSSIQHVCNNSAFVSNIILTNQLVDAGRSKGQPPIDKIPTPDTHYGKIPPRLSLHPHAVPTDAADAEPTVVENLHYGESFGSDVSYRDLLEIQRRKSRNSFVPSSELRALQQHANTPASSSPGVRGMRASRSFTGRESVVDMYMSMPPTGETDVETYSDPVRQRGSTVATPRSIYFNREPRSVMTSPRAGARNTAQLEDVGYEAVPIRNSHDEHI